MKSNVFAYRSVVETLLLALVLPDCNRVVRIYKVRGGGGAQRVHKGGPLRRVDTSEHGPVTRMTHSLAVFVAGS